MPVTQSHEAVRLVTKREAADVLQVSIRTIDRYIAEGTLASVQLSKRATRVTADSLHALAGGAA